MPMPKGHKVLRQKNLPPEAIPLTKDEYAFVAEYLNTGSAIQAWKNLGWGTELSDYKRSTKANDMLHKANVKAEIMRAMDEIELQGHKQVIASGNEVMSYFTSVMRGELKDQFGLDAPLSERTKAAQELAKRTIDLENRRAGEADQVVAIKLDWSRNN